MENQLFDLNFLRKQRFLKRMILAGVTNWGKMMQDWDEHVSWTHMLVRQHDVGRGTPGAETFVGYLNIQLTVNRYCDNGPDFGVPTCVTVNAGLFMSTISQDDANQRATDYANAILYELPPVCCIGDPLPATMIRDVTWTVGSQMAPAFGPPVASFAGTPTDVAGASGTVSQAAIGDGSTVASSISWTTTWCNPWPSYDLTVDMDYVVTGLGGAGNECKIVVNGNSTSYGVNGSGHYTIVVPVNTLGEQNMIISIVADKLGGLSPGTPQIAVTSIKVRPLVPPVTTPDSCTIVSVNNSPANDNFVDATLITGESGTINGTNVGASLEVGEPSVVDSAGIQKSIWYKWTAPSSGSKTFDTIGSSFDTVLGIYTGAAVNALVLVGANDEGAGIDPRSRVTFTAVIGTVYRIQVSGFHGHSGSVTLNWA